MALTLADVGADIILKAYFNNNWAAGGKDLTIKLFALDVTPADTDIASTYTAAVGGGYVDKTLANGSWTVTVLTDPSVATYVETVWTFTGALTTNANIYGYFVVDADGVLLYAEKLTVPFTPANNGDLLKITPKFQLSKGTPT